MADIEKITINDVVGFIAGTVGKRGNILGGGVRGAGGKRFRVDDKNIKAN